MNGLDPKVTCSEPKFLLCGASILAEKVDNKQEDTITTEMSTDGKWPMKDIRQDKGKGCERNDIKEIIFKQISG